MQIEREYSRKSELRTMNMNTRPRLFSVKSYKLMRPFFVGLIATSLLGAAATSWGTVYSWTGTAGDYNNASNWTPGFVPSGTDSVYIGGATTTIYLNGGTFAINTITNSPTTSSVINSQSGTSVFNIGTIEGGSGSYQFRNGSSTPTVQLYLNVGNINITSGITYLGGSSVSNQSSLYALAVSGTTSLSNGVINVNVNGPGSTYSLGLLNVTSGSVSLNLVGSNNKGATTANVTGLTGSGGIIQNSALTNTGSNTSTLVITNTGNYSSATRLINGISGTAPTGSLSLVKAGAGTQTLTGSNTYTGNTTVTEGTLRVTGGSATMSSLGFGGAMILSSTVGTTSVAGGTVDLSGNLVLNEAVSLDGGSLVNSTAGVTGTLGNGLAGIQFSSSGTNYSGSALTISGGGGSGAAGTFTLGFTGTVPNSSIGSITLTNAGSGYTDGGAVTLTPAGGGTGFVGTAVLSSLTLTGTNNSIGGAGNLVIAAAVGGSGGFAKVGTGTTTLSASNTYLGETKINAGGLIVSSDANLGSSEGTVSFDGGTLLMTTSGTLSSDRNTTINAGGAKFYNASNTLNTWGGDISGVGSLTKQGTNQATSILYLTGSNTYQGGTIIQSGVLRVDSDQNLGDAAGTVTFNNAGNTGRLETVQSMTSNRDFILNGTTAGIATTGTGNVTVLNGDISGAGVLEKRFVGTLHLTGSNSYASTSITGGVVRVDADQNLGLGAVNFNNTSSASTLETTQTFTSSKNMALNNTTSTATVMTTGTGNTTTWNGQITGSGPGGFVKGGSGVLVLSASNSYSAGTAVSAGTLLLTNASAAGSGAVAISGGNGTTLHVNVDAGAGSISNTVVFTSAVNGGAYVLERANGSAFSDYEASSSISGGVNTTASLLAGTASTDRTLSTSLSLTASVAATNEGVVLSDIFSLAGTGTDIFVLQLQIANVEVGQYLGWLNGTNTWVNAIDGNTDLGGSAVQGYAGSYAASGAAATSDYLGSWGYDTTNDTVWAVLDHNSEFAVIPEPSTWALLAIGLGSVVILGVKRRRLG